MLLYVLGSAFIPKVSDLEDDNGIAPTRSGEYLLRVNSNHSKFECQLNCGFVTHILHKHNFGVKPCELLYLLIEGTKIEDLWETVY